MADDNGVMARDTFFVNCGRHARPAGAFSRRLLERGQSLLPGAATGSPQVGDVHRHTRRRVWGTGWHTNNSPVRMILQFVFDLEVVCNVRAACQMLRSCLQNIGKKYSFDWNIQHVLLQGGTRHGEVDERATLEMLVQLKAS